MSEWNGEDRRGKPVPNGHCDMHAQNTETLNTNSNDLGKMTANYLQLKWIIGVGLPIVVAAGGFFYQGNQNVLREVMTEMKDIKIIVTANQVSSAVILNRLDMHEREINELNQKIEARHGR